MSPLARRVSTILGVAFIWLVVYGYARVEVEVGAGASSFAALVAALVVGALLYWFLGRSGIGVSASVGEGARLVARVGQGPVAAPVGMRFPRFEVLPGQAESLAGQEVDGLRVKTFDYRIATAPEEGIRWFSCCVGSIGASCPQVAIARIALAELPSAPSSLPKVAFESEFFNLEISIRCADARVAHALVDERMMEWLLLLPTGWGIQTSGEQVLVYGPKRKPGDAGALTDLLRDFLAHVPLSLSSLYPPP